MKNFRKAFTLIELLVVIAIIAILSVVVILTLNPAQLLKQSRDSNRLSDIGTLNTALGLYTEGTGGLSGGLGSSSITYISIPDPTATTTAGTNCAGLGFPASNTNLHCVASSTLRNTNGTGWIPINFASSSNGAPFGALPIDAINTTSSGDYYRYETNGTTFKLKACPESSKYSANPSYFTQGNGQSFSIPYGCGPQNIWVLDNNYVEEFSPSGSNLLKFGSYGYNNGQFLNPYGFAIDGSGNIWVADSGDNRIQEFSSNGTYILQIGLPPTYSMMTRNNGSGNGQFNYPWGIAIDGSGNVWVADNNNNRIQEFSSSGSYLSQFGTYGSGNGQFIGPVALAADANGNIWVVDSGNNRVQEFSSAGVYESQFGSAGTGNGQFNDPWGIAIDSNGNIWVVDTNNNRVEEFSSSGTYISQFGSSGSGNGQLNDPTGIAIDAGGNVWIADYLNSRFEKFSSSGTYLSQFASSTFQFYGPTGVAIY